MTEHTAETEAPCASDLPWVAHRPEDMSKDLSNIICPGVDGIIATGLPNHTAMQIVDAHNGCFTAHDTDQITLTY
jgi:hypothetical protein